MYSNFYTSLIIFGFISSIVANYDARYLRHGSQKNEIDGGTCAEFKRLNAMDKCCEVRDDDCYMIHYDTRCYCDVFCDRDMMNDHSDCCPDAANVCSVNYIQLNVTTTPVAKKGCRDNKGKVYKHEELSKDNCAECKCFDGKLECSNPTCLINIKLLDEINRSRETWKASNYSMFWGQTLDYGYNHRLGTRLPSRSQGPLEMEDELEIKSYDFRNQYEFAKNRRIQDQENCGASWAFSTVDVLNDRLGKTDPTRMNLTASVQMLLSCSVLGTTNGCSALHVDAAWNHIHLSNGLVDNECYPYESGASGIATTCIDLINDGFNYKCPSNKKYPKNRMIKSSRAYPIRAENSNDIMTEIYENGPVQVVFKVYDDFFMYKSGIYKKSPHAKALNNVNSYHSVKLLGWGTENNVDYWIAANSWGENWGENGYFRIVRDDTDTEFGRHVYGSIISRHVNTMNNRLRRYRSRYRNRALKYRNKLRKYKKRF